jgi:signal transduction histidine kinase
MAKNLQSKSISSPESFVKKSNLDVTPKQKQRAFLNILEDMQEQKQATEDQRKATFNILEDVTLAQAQLKGRLLQVQTLRDTLENLAVSTDPKYVMETVVHSLTKIIPYYSLSYIIWQGEGAEFTNTIYINAKGPFGRAYVTHIQRELIAFIEGLPNKVSNRESLSKQMHQKIYTEFISDFYDEQRGLIPTASFVTPFYLRSPDTTGTSSILGLFHIATINPADRLTDYQLEIIQDIASVAAMNMERIRSIAATEQARLASLLRSMTNGVILFDSLYNVQLCNPSASRMLGVMEQDPVKSLQQQQQQQQITFSEIQKLLDKDSTNFSTKVNRLLKEGVEFHIEEFNLLRFTYEIFLTSVRNLSGGIIGGAIILHDITHLKEVDRMKTEFVSVASHQLRTPLTAIKLFIEMLGDETNGTMNEQQKAYIADVATSTQRMIKLVNDLLNVSRIETGRLRIEPKPTQIEDFIQSIINEADSMAKVKKCRLVFKHPKDNLPKIPIDQSLMRQVVHNLVMNAIRYSSKKQCDILVTLEQKNHDYVIAVKDNGIGIIKNNQARIFEKFYRSDRARKLEAEGSGLGMYVAKMIMEASGGKIWFESEGDNKGTTFYVTLPISGMRVKKGTKGIAS